ncbi:hypothetical protein EJ110_NYTH58292 [Nymphaea thermarum]|nr:hypothetical protein EJ110_NYTH58292 [Nymphaea thermarum]
MVAINLSITLNFNCEVLNEPTPQGVVHRRNDRNHPAHCITGRGGRFWSRREAPDKHLHGVLNTTVVAAALIATLAFSALLNPPGGVYQEGALAGRAILSTHRLFDVFLFFNVIALLTSLAIVVMLSTYVAFTRDRLICRWDVAQTLTDISAKCMLIDYVIGAWLIYCPTTKKFPVMITLSALVFESIGATVVNYLMWKLRIRVPHLQKFINQFSIPAQAVDDQKEDEELLI